MRKFLALLLTFCMLATLALAVAADDGAAVVTEPTETNDRDDYAFTVGGKYDEDPTITSLTIFDDCPYILAGSTGNLQFNTLNNPTWCAYYSDKTRFIVYKFEVTRPGELKDFVFDAYFCGHLKVEVMAAGDAADVSELSEEDWKLVYSWASSTGSETPGNERVIRKNAYDLGFANDLKLAVISSVDADHNFVYIRIGDSYPNDGFGGGIMRFGVGEDGKEAIYENHVQFIYSDDSGCEHEYDNDCDTTCNKCGALRTPHHTYDNDCDESCNVCGAVRQVKHDWSEEYSSNETQHWHTCKTCGKTDPADHKFATECDPDCDVCGYKRETSHEFGDFKSNNQKHWKECSKCGERIEEGAHEWNAGEVTTEPTVDAKGERTFTCSVCGKTKKEEIAKLPKLVSGIEGEWEKGAAASIKVDEAATGIKVDGTALTNADYTLSADGMTITLNEEYLGKLAAGEHKVVITTGNGTVETSFTVAAAKSNSTLIIIIVAAVVVVAAAAVVVVLISKKKKA